MRCLGLLLRFSRGPWRALVVQPVLMLLTLTPVPRLAAQPAPDDILSSAGAVSEWVARLEENEREVLDRVVVCFDEASFVREISRWDADRFWPVLLWDSELVPGFIEAFEPAQVLLARYAEPGTPDAETALSAVLQAWGAEPPAGRLDAAGRLDTLLDLGRDPLGLVLLEEDSPEWLGGLALAAGRFSLPLLFATAEKHAQRITAERLAAISGELIERLDNLEIEYRDRFVDLDFVTVANDMPFGYTRSAPSAHPGGYTVDDALARNDDLTRWGWVGRLVGGATRSVFMAMGALFLQPSEGLFWSRYNRSNPVFGAFDPEPALAIFNELFPTTVIRHPDATLERWRKLQWPEGNRFAFLYVNSSGGATNWSTSGGQAGYFDVPATVPCVVHYTHSGSAARPYETDSIAGRWLTGGAYIYSGSYAEPYLQSFIPPGTLAGRVARGVPLGAALRKVYDPDAMGARKMSVGGAEQVVRFNMTGPWKLAYLGDPAYRLRRGRPARLEPDRQGKNTFRSLAAFLRARPRDEDQARRHRGACIGVARLARFIDNGLARLVDERLWRRVVKAASPGELAGLQREMVRAWVASSRESVSTGRAKGHSSASDRRIPGPIVELLDRGVVSPEAGRCVAEYAKQVVAVAVQRAEAGADDAAAPARGALETACCFGHSRGSRKPFYQWVVAACRTLGIDPAALRARVLKHTWIPPEVRDAVSMSLPVNKRSGTKKRSKKRPMEPQKAGRSMRRASG